MLLNKYFSVIFPQIFTVAGSTSVVIVIEQRQLLLHYTQTCYTCYSSFHVMISLSGDIFMTDKSSSVSVRLKTLQISVYLCDLLVTLGIFG